MKKEIFTRAEVRYILTEAIKQARKRVQTAKQPEHSRWGGGDRIKRLTGQYRRFCWLVLFNGFVIPHKLPRIS
ncbi:MAG: hypothetical protein OXF24_06390 [Hyphomicrobiales bacterium]|nr:hypothetical protein [Hyphomicrobiales bacterium]